MTPRIVIPPEPVATTPPLPQQTRRRWWVNVTAGVIIIAAIVLALILGHAALGSWLNEPTIHVVTYIPGSVDIEPNVDITYNGDIVGKIDSAHVNLPATQLYVSRGEADPATWHVLTFPSGMVDTASAGPILIVSSGTTISVTDVSAGGEIESPQALILRITPVPGASTGRIEYASFKAEPVLNGRAKTFAGQAIESGDEIEFHAGNESYALRWTAPGPYTRVYGRLAYKQLLKQTLVKTDSSRLINSSTSLSISNTFGLTKTSARFVPTFDPPLLLHAARFEVRKSSATPGFGPSGNFQYFVEMRSGGSASLDDLQATLAYLTSRTRMNRPPANRLEYMASNIDTTLAGIKGTVNDVRDSSLPAVRNLVHGAGYHVDTLSRSLEEKLQSLQGDISRLTNTANGSIGKLTDSTASTMAALQLRIDLLLEEIRLTTTQLRKTANGVGADIRNVVK